MVKDNRRNSELLDEIETSELKIKQLQKQVEQLEGDYKNLSEKLGKFKKEKDADITEAVRVALEVERSSVATTSKVKGGKDDETKKLKKERDTARKERDARPDITIANYAQEKQDAVDALVAMKKERDDRGDITPTDLQELRDRLSQTQKDLLASETAKTTAENALATLTAERDKAISDLATAKGPLINPTKDSDVTKANLVRKTTYDKDLQALQNQLNAKNNFVDPANYFLKTHLQTEASKAGWKYTEIDLTNAKKGLFTQAQLDEAINSATKGSFDPTNYILKSTYDIDLAAAKGEKDTFTIERDKARQERDDRPEITIADWKDLQDQLNAKNNFADPKDLDELKTTLTRELGIDLNNSNWHTNLVSKLGGASLAEIPNFQTLKSLLENDPGNNDSGNSTERIKNLEVEIALLKFTFRATMDQIIEAIGTGSWKKYNNRVQEFVKVWERKQKEGIEYKPTLRAYIEQKAIGQ